MLHRIRQAWAVQGSGAFSGPAEVDETCMAGNARKHLNRYVQEFAGKHNVRESDTVAQMTAVATALVGRRLLYRDLIAPNGLPFGARGGRQGPQEGAGDVERSCVLIAGIPDVHKALSDCRSATISSTARSIRVFSRGSDSRTSLPNTSIQPPFDRPDFLPNTGIQPLFDRPDFLP